MRVNFCRIRSNFGAEKHYKMTRFIFIFGFISATLMVMSAKKHVAYGSTAGHTLQKVVIEVPMVGGTFGVSFGMADGKRHCSVQG